MLVPKSSRFEFAGEPIELLREAQSLFSRHRAQSGDLFGAWGLIQKHKHSVVESVPRGKH